MATSPTLRLILRCRSSILDVRRRAVDELVALDPDRLSLSDIGAIVTSIPDLIVDGDIEPARRVLMMLRRDLGGLEPARFERIYPYLPADLGPLVIGALARQLRPEAWLALGRVLHLELSQPEHAVPAEDTLSPLGEICHEPTFVIDAILEAVIDPQWTAQAVHVLVDWHERDLVGERDLARFREAVLVFDELMASGTGILVANDESGRAEVEELIEQSV